jgi:hypothetical protein
VIPQQHVADKVREANAAAGVGDLVEAMGLLAEASEAIFDSPRPARRDQIGQFGDSIRTMTEYNLRSALHPPAATAHACPLAPPISRSHL